MKITALGIDLAKNVFQVHGVDAHGKTTIRRSLKRAQMKAFFANLPPCLIGMEACSSAHYWARELMTFGHTVRLMAPQFVKPYVKSNKNDMNDAEAICEAVTRPNMRFVAIKNAEQQALLILHRARQGFVHARTAQVNQLRGLLAEFGLVLPIGVHRLRKQLLEMLEDGENGLPGVSRDLFHRLFEHFIELDRHVKDIDAQIQAWHRADATSQRLQAIPGVGPITATALVASIGNAKEFRNGRQLDAWLGLVPRQHSSGGKEQLLGISKRGDAYLRTLLIQGARSVLKHVRAGADSSATWIERLLARRNHNVAAVALANKNARIIWALLAHDRVFRMDYGNRAVTAA